MTEKSNIKEIPSGKALGGIARAEALTAGQRKEIAQKAASARWTSSTPKASYEGELNIAGVVIPCAVAEVNGVIHRLIVQREVVGLLTGNKKGGLDRYLEASNLQKFVPAKFRGKSLDEVALVVEIGGRKAHCYEGEDIVDLCKMYLDARKVPNALLPSQRHLADQAEIIVTSLAKVGIAGLIDEATGYQNVRAKDALQAYLEKVLRKELAAWVQRFPNEFFEQMFRLKKWPWTGSNRRPQVVGKYIKDVVYSRLGPGILDELEKRNPKNNKGNRTAKHHQWLTEDIGNPALAQHLYAVTGLMRMSDSWEQFKKNLEKAYPKKDSPQLHLFDR